MVGDLSVISISWGGFLPPPLFFLGSIGILNKIINKNYYTYSFSFILFFLSSIGILNKIVNKIFCTYSFSLITILFRIKMRHKTIKKWESWKRWEWDSRKWSQAHVRVVYLKVKMKLLGSFVLSGDFPVYFLFPKIPYLNIFL